MVYSVTLLSYTYWKIPSTVHTNASDKQLGSVISQNNKTIALFSRILSKPQHNYNTTKKELFVIVECLKKFCRILFGYEISVFSYHTNMVYATTLSEYQRVIRWLLILGDFGPNIQHIDGVYNIVSDTLIIFPYTSVNKYEPITSKSQCCADELFKIGWKEKKRIFPAKYTKCAKRATQILVPPNG